MVAMLTLCSLGLTAQPADVAADRSVARILADYDSELRGGDGHVDTPLMIQQLKALGVNCYFWLIWHAETDWEDLQAFLPAAQEAGLDVWVYLCPPSEPPPSAPFGLDFVRWGEEIAKLSLQFNNLRAWCIDDFYANRTTLTPEYIAEMQRAAKAIAPKLAFYPLMYYPEIHYAFASAYAPVVDGVVVAYPTSREELARAGRVLRDEIPVPPRCVMKYPWDTPSAPGDGLRVSREVRVDPEAQIHRLTVRQRDLFTAGTEGYHFKQVLVDGEVVWEEDVAGGDLEWQEVHVDLARAVRKQTVTLSLACTDKKGVSNFGVEVEWSDLRLEGFQEAGLDVGREEDWRTDVQGKWEVTWQAKAGGTGRFSLPYIVMPAGTANDLRKRLPGSQGTPEELAAHLRMVLEAMKVGECDGVVTYCLPKATGNEHFEAARQVYEEMLPGLPLAP